MVSGFSGVTALRPKANAKLEDYIIIDTQSAALQVFDLSQMYGPDNARLVQAQRLNMVPAKQIGQVFGVTLDDGQPATGRRVKNPVANIYATATSAYGLYLVETKKVGNQFVRERAKTGSPQASWMDGQFGPGGGPGSIWKINGRTGEVNLFANVTLNGVANSGPALGSIVFDPKTRRLFVSDMQTGMIHAYDLTGREVGMFDHGFQGRARQGLPPVAFDPNSSVPVTSHAFNAENPASWGLANRSRRVWGLAVNGGRLYYAPIEGPDIWSVGLNEGGGFANDARVEIEVFSQSGDPISTIAFGRDGTMYLSQRGQLRSAYDYKVMATPGTAEVLRYKRRRLPSGRLTWEPAPKEYAIGYAQKNRSANGGLALGYGYDEYGYIRYDVCQGTLWSTGEILRQSATPDPRLTAGGQTIVHGLQGNPVGAVKPINSPPLKAFFVDYDGQFIDPSYRGHMGGVAIWSACPKGVAKPKRPKGPLIRIAKSCSAAAFGIDLHCRVTLTSTGTVAPKGKVGFSDLGKVLSGPAFASKNPLIVSADPDDPNWSCSNLPDRKFSCSLPGAIMQPGQSRSVDIVMDIAEVVDTPDWLIQNCAKLNGSKKTSCVTRGERDALIVTKFSPIQQPCIAGGPCDFEVSVFNPGKQTFDGELFLADNLTIGGAPASGITVDAVFPQHGCDIRGLTLPLDWVCHTTIPPGGERFFNIQLTIPKSAVPAGVTQGRNCFVATDPGLALGSNGLPNHFWNNMLDPANTNFQLGRDCVNFDILPTGVIPPRNPGIPFGAKMQLSASTHPGIFSAAGQDITYGYKVLNTGNQQITSFKLTDTKATGIKCPPLTGGVLAPGASVICLDSYKTKAGDVGKDIVSTAKLTGKTTSGNVPQPASVKTRVIFSPAAKVSLAVWPKPSTFSKAGEQILYRYIVRNTGGVPITSSALTDSRGTKITCRPSGGAIPVGFTAFCAGTYTTKPGDVGKDITSLTKLTGKTASGTVKSPPPTNSVVTFVKPSTSPVTSNKPELTLVEYTPQPASFLRANEKITYKYKVRNTGNLLIINFILTDTKAPNIKCPTNGPLAIGAEVICTGGTYTTTSADVGRKVVESTANVTGSSVAGATDASAPSASKSAKVTYFKPKPLGTGTGGGGKSQQPPANAPALSFRVTPAPSTFSASGETINYTYMITNSGKVPVTRLSLADSKATGINCGPYGGPIKAGASVTCKGSYLTSQTDVGRDITNYANVYGTSAQGKVPPAAGSSVVTFVGKLAFNLVVVPSYPAYSAANHKIDYTYTVTNTSSLPLTVVGINDSRVPNINCGPYAGWGIFRFSPTALAPGNQLVCVGSYVTQGSDVGSDITTTATATGTSASGAAPPPASANALVKFFPPPLTGTPKLDVKVSPSVVNFSGSGQSIVFTYTVSNIGTMPMNSFSLREVKPRVRGLSCRPVPIGGPLGVNQTTTCTAIYITTPTDVTKGTSSWNFFLGGYANKKVPSLKTTSWPTSKSKPKCPPGDKNCEIAAVNCGTMEPKWIYRAPQGMNPNGWNLGELARSNTNQKQQNYKPWYTGCRGNSAFAATFPYAGPTATLPVPQYVKNAYRNRGCDIFCSQNHAPRQCKPKDPGLSSIVVDEIPTTRSALNNQKFLWVCPWKITKNWGGAPSAPEPVPPPTQASTFCWKPGGKGGCPSGFTNCGLGCQLGGSADCAGKIVGQVFAAIKAIPVIGKALGWIKEAAGKVWNFLTGGGKAVSTVSHMQKVWMIEKALGKYKAYHSAKAAWEKTEKARNAWKVNKGSDRSSGLLNTTTGANIPRFNPGFGSQATNEQKIWKAAHDAAGIMSIIPGPTGAIAGALDAYGHPECRR